MTEIDQFESVFKSADKTPFAFEAVAIDTVLMVTDVDATRTRELGESTAQFLRALGTDVAWQNHAWNPERGIFKLTVRVDERLFWQTFKELHPD